MKNLTEQEISDKYSNIEDKIPAVWPDYKTAGIELAQDLVLTWDVKNPELYRVISLVSMYVPEIRITQHLDASLSFMGLYPNVQKRYDIRTYEPGWS